MKIRTIVGVLLVFALVLGSTGIGAAANHVGDRDGDGPDELKLKDGSCNKRPNCDEDPDEIKDRIRQKWN